jgi:hypothetical protein
LRERICTHGGSRAARARVDDLTDGWKRVGHLGSPPSVGCWFHHDGNYDRSITHAWEARTRWARAFGCWPQPEANAGPRRQSVAVGPPMSRAAAPMRGDGDRDHRGCRPRPASRAHGPGNGMLLNIVAPLELRRARTARAATHPASRTSCGARITSQRPRSVRGAPGPGGSSISPPPVCWPHRSQRKSAPTLPPQPACRVSRGGPCGVG